MPQLFSADRGWQGKHLGLARVLTGDEPHYLVLVNSILNDDDLDLRNNYESVLHGSLQAGSRFAFSDLDHHVSYYVNGERKIWTELFLPRMSLWPLSPDGHRVPILRPGFDPSLARAPEYSAHPVGVAFLVAPFLFPFRNTSALEPMAILLAGIATVLAMLLYRKTLFQFSDDPFAVYFCLFGVFLGTPIWYYSRTFFNEPFIMLAVVGAYAVIALRKSSWVAGCFLAGGMLMKPQLVLLAAPMLAPDLLRRDWRRAIGFLPPLIAAGLVILYWNQHMFGSPLRGPYPFYRGNFLDGAGGLLLSPTHGLFAWAPILILALLGWPSLIKRYPVPAAAAGVAFLMIFGLTAWWAYWHGGVCFGPRLIVPILPLLGLGLVMVPRLPVLRTGAARLLLVTVVACSIAMNYAAVRRFWEFLDNGASLSRVISFWRG